MPTIAELIAINVGLVAAVGGLIAFWIRKWLSNTLDFRFKLLEERAKLELELQKAQAANILGQRNTIYPELLEVVYRLRNTLRDIREVLPEDYSGVARQGWRNDKFVKAARKFDPALYLLTENLYKYRAYVDESVFEKLHTFKRQLQNAAVHIDRMTRPPDSFGRMPFDEQTYETSSELLAEAYEYVDRLYLEITATIREALERHVPKLHNP